MDEEYPGIEDRDDGNQGAEQVHHPYSPCMLITDAAYQQILCQAGLPDVVPSPAESANLTRAVM
ncbi:hypothetical protein SDC9_89903 [bioreactor metagenome]|uniref:Uncharacterized protein n=1 Tax=bioreactor metagenome TaxID=1076179 RepID=A0A644ZQI0_9ZZZZ